MENENDVDGLVEKKIEENRGFMMENFITSFLMHTEMSPEQKLKTIEEYISLAKTLRKTIVLLHIKDKEKVAEAIKFFEGEFKEYVFEYLNCCDTAPDYYHTYMEHPKEIFSGEILPYYLQQQGVEHTLKMISKIVKEHATTTNFFSNGKYVLMRWLRMMTMSKSCETMIENIPNLKTVMNKCCTINLSSLMVAKQKRSRKTSKKPQKEKELEVVACYNEQGNMTNASQTCQENNTFEPPQETNISHPSHQTNNSEQPEEQNSNNTQGTHSNMQAESNEVLNLYTIRKPKKIIRIQKKEAPETVSKLAAFSEKFNLESLRAEVKAANVPVAAPSNTTIPAQNDIERNDTHGDESNKTKNTVNSNNHGTSVNINDNGVAMNNSTNDNNDKNNNNNNNNNINSINDKNNNNNNSNKNCNSTASQSTSIATSSTNKKGRNKNEEEEKCGGKISFDFQPSIFSKNDALAQMNGKKLKTVAEKLKKDMEDEKLTIGSTTYTNKRKTYANNKESWVLQERNKNREFFGVDVVEYEGHISLLYFISSVENSEKETYVFHFDPTGNHLEKIYLTFNISPLKAPIVKDDTHDAYACGASIKKTLQFLKENQKSEIAVADILKWAKLQSEFCDADLEEIVQICTRKRKR